MSRYRGKGSGAMPTPATTAGFHRMLGSISYSPSVPLANTSSGPYTDVPAIPAQQTRSAARQGRRVQQPLTSHQPQMLADVSGKINGHMLMTTAWLL